MTTIAKMSVIPGIKLNRPQFEDIVLYRIQLRLTTGTGNSAGTDDPVQVQLNNIDTPFVLRKGIDNFEEGHTDLYDVLSRKIKNVKDIQFLKFSVRGNDGVCLKKIELFFNGCSIPVFTKEYSGSGSCIDNDTPSLPKFILISGNELRSFANWRYTTANSDIWLPLKVIPKEMIVSMVEAAIGHQITIENNSVAWGTRGSVYNTLWGPAVEVSFVNDKTLHFDLDLEKSVTGLNPEVDVDFDLEFECLNGIISMKVKNIKTGTNWVGEADQWLTTEGVKLLVNALAGEVGIPGGGFISGLLSDFLSFSLNFDPENPQSSLSCKFIKVTSNCDIHLF